MYTYDRQISLLEKPEPWENKQHKTGKTGM